MLKIGLSVVLMMTWAPAAVRAEEVETLESAAELSVGSAELLSQMMAEDPAFFALILGPESTSYLLTTAGTLFTVGGAVMLINRPRLMRRYRDAAAEARALKVEFPAAPITHARADGSLADVLKRERAVARETGFAIDRLSEPQLANLVIARAKLLELQ